ncbi:efflux RND transporter permease subunit [uncultured Thioclava sp.]|uniref:efflux RND transporter permease subunit n=1 Tax=uncultured Thioclava sp. TaxID=473858 RepID=UPI0025DCA45F|nr:efflux RND transporter permease subunit [uncultured Thioclava sp.]
MIRFFIHRPVFAIVLALVTILAGGYAVTQLPVSQYPEVAPTTIRISASYSGATAQAVENSVTTPIEDSLTGLDGMLYMESRSNQGSSRVTLTFDSSITPIDAENEVQTKIRQIESQLPDAVQTSGVNVSRSASDILMVGALVSSDGKYSTVELGNILDTEVKGSVERTAGVGGLNIFGSGFAMRVWLDPYKLEQYQLTANDVTTAVKAQNTTVSVGSLGDLPTTQGQQFTATITAQSQLTSVDQFEKILLKTESDGSAVYLGDVARIEIGQQDYGTNSKFNGMNASGFGVNLASGANAVDTAAAVRATLDRLAPSLPAGVSFQIAYDTSPFVKLSIEKVYHTLAEAILLVLLVILIFLQKWRATLIPIVAVPVVLMGTFAVLLVAGYSINTLTMFAMVLAIGLLVDDAIVVVENVERVMEEEGLSPMQATEKSMSQITGALVGVALVLSAVFLPMAFFPGSTGVIYRQFSVTIITAMVLSAVVALILTPALAAKLLRPAKGRPIAPARVFNTGFGKVRGGYVAAVKRILRKPFLMALVLVVVLAAAWGVTQRLPSSFLPKEDQGVMMVIVNLSDGSTTAQTSDVVDQITHYLLTQEKADVTSVFATLGFAYGGSGQNTAMVFAKLKDFSQRSGIQQGVAAIAARGNAHFAGLRAGQVFFVQPSSIRGLGNTSGFQMYLVDQSNAGTAALSAAADTLVTEAKADPRLTNVRVRGADDNAALQLNIDQQKAESFGLSLSDLNSMLSVIFSGRNVNDFDLNGNLRPVIVQADAPYRMQPGDIDTWYARNSGGEMVPFSAFASTKWVSIAPQLSRYNATNAIEISGQSSQSTSSGAAMDAMQELVSNLPGGYGLAWTGLSYQERQSGNQAPFLYALSVLVVFLCLAALYESWSIPLSVMLAVPVGVLGALAAAWVSGQANDVYFKVGILTTIGLAAKNAILIVEFARNLEAEGRELIEATLEAARLRLRPILMTSLAFMLGVLPLAIATGAGASAQKAIGIGVLGGMAAATFIGVFMVPAFYVLVRKLTPKGKPQVK